MKSLIQRTHTWRPREADVERFTNGDCHILAAVLHRETGWQLGSFATHDYPDGPDVHAFVIHPSGCYLDVEGAHNPLEFVRGWQEEQDDVIGVTANTLAQFHEADWGRWGIFGDYSRRRARIITKRLVEHFDV